jgi:hypothetical protein
LTDLGDICCAVKLAAAYSQPKIFDNSRALPHLRRYDDPGRRHIFILSKRIEKPSANFPHGSLDAATHSANSERVLQVFLSAQLELIDSYSLSLRIEADYPMR